MRCKQCGSSFRISIWIMQCGECREQYCTRCMKRMNGICYCQKCTVLISRPPDINELMKLKSKDLQAYLNRHNVTTFGLVEKRELVDLLCNRAIPVKNTKSSTVLNKIFSNFESVLNLPDRINGQERRNRPPQERPIFASSSSGNIYTQSRFNEENVSNTLPKERRPPPPPPQTTVPPEYPQATTSTAESSPLPRKIPNLSDYANVEDLSNLSAKQLKILLSFNRVDYKGCVEKTELLEKAERLWQDNHKHKSDEMPENLDDLCKLCMDAPLDCVLLECGHIATCINCGKKLAECPICRQYVSRVVRTFKA